MSEAIVLLSGGLDSATALAVAVEKGHDIVALTFDYGQRHKREVESARKIAKHYKIKDHIVIPLDLGRLLKSSLTQKHLAIPEGGPKGEVSSGIPSTYVPARNMIFLSIATSIAESRGAEHVYIGVNAVDYSGYPDCRPEYIEAFERMANLATKAGVEGRLRIKIRTPLIQMTKADIIRKGVELGVDYRLTHSCYDPSPEGKACGQCDSCLLRKKGFREAGVSDPTEYR